MSNEVSDQTFVQALLCRFSHVIEEFCHNCQHALKQNLHADYMANRPLVWLLEGASVSL